MRRLMLACVFTGIAAAAAAAPPPSRVIDLATRGVPAATPAANVRILQAAIDELGNAAVADSAAKVVLPPCDVPIDRPIFLDRNGVGLEGHGKGISRLVATLGHDAVVVGVARRPAGWPAVPPVAADHLVDLHTAGWLTGVTTAPGQKWAFRTKADSHLAQQGGPLDDYPGGQAALTVEVAADLSRLRAPGGSYARARSASFCGLTDRAASAPWEIVLGNDVYLFRMQSDSGQIVQVGFGQIAATPGFVRITVQVDLAAGAVATWVDDRRVPNDARVPADFRALAANQHSPFGVGANAANANGVADWFGGASDITFAGLRVSRAALYKGDAAVLTRRDGAAVTDNRYFAREDATAGLLALADAPADVARTRTMAATAPDFGQSTLYLLDNAGHLSNYATVAPGPIRRLSLVCQRPQGRALAVGYALGLRVEDCALLGGRGGLAAINFGATYPVSVRDCDVRGSDSPLSLYSTAAAAVDRVNVVGTFRCAIRLVDSAATVRNVFAPAWGRSDHYLRSERSAFLLEDCAFDNEAGQGAQVAPIYATPRPGYPTLCRVTRCNFATYRPGAPLAILAGEAPAGTRLAFTIADCDDVIRGASGPGAIEATAGWSVTKDY